MTPRQYEGLRLLVLVILTEVTDSWLWIVWWILAVVAIIRYIAASD